MKVSKEDLVTILNCASNNTFTKRGDFIQSDYLSFASARKLKVWTNTLLAKLKITNYNTLIVRNELFEKQYCLFLVRRLNK
jgi:hypothetical protein